VQRIESGRLRGRRLLPLPRGVDGLRPTAAMVRAAIFDRLQAELAQARILDLFAGSGALSFEALSRGAATATLVEAHPRVARHLQAQAAALSLGEAATVVHADARRFLARAAAPHDVVLIDPPFAIPEIVDEVLGDLTRGWLAEGAVVVVERERIRGRAPDLSCPQGLSLEATRAYGQAQVDFLRSDLAPP
jgi:16S rRNA (guanine966-N2)-methyltransferase